MRYDTLGGGTSSNKSIYGYDARCKVCQSPHCTEITEMILEGISYKAIAEAFTDEKFSESSIARHANHINVIQDSVDIYLEQKAIATVEIVDEMDVLDKTTKKCFEFLEDVDFGETPPRKLEVVGELMIKTIRLKHEIIGAPESGKETLIDYFKKALNADEVINGPATEIESGEDTE